MKGLGTEGLGVEGFGGWACYRYFVRLYFVCSKLYSSLSTPFGAYMPLIFRKSFTGRVFKGFTPGVPLYVAA